ncbi:MAG: PTS sugar transporter subunit IIC [Erysipelotrichia bacterium]|nr:PTS sugar transporter subunit IIC [Erysipelotrichia bacterium]
MIQNALLCVLAYWICQTVDSLLSWQTFSRPIVAAPLAGLLLGDPATGIIMGASLESIFMGISAIGGSVPADALTSSIIAVAFTVLTGTSIEEGLAIAMPIGTLMATFASFATPLFAALSPYWEEQVVKDNMKAFKVKTFLFQFTLGRGLQMIVLFFAVAYGTTALNNLLASLPVWVSSGLGAASGMMTGVGYAILLSMLWNKEVGCFFFLGFVLSKYLGMDSLSIAIVGVVFAITMFYIDKKFIDLKSAYADGKAEIKKSNEEDFF